MKAYVGVIDEHEGYQEIVFADTANGAKQKFQALPECDLEYTDVRVRRAKYADGYENVSLKEFREMQLDNDWWMTCYKTGKQVFKEDVDYVDEDGHVYSKEAVSNV
ncbi:hypothetical protein ACIQLG_19880 [Terribacillus saccharophilus]|uniref:hypothetical protein n=1 Tax=Terribacillus saccharophilus TaxID=361277 RepID=UPI003829ED43